MRQFGQSGSSINNLLKSRSTSSFHHTNTNIAKANAATVMATAARLRPSSIPNCPACARRFIDLGLSGLRQQIRGKKKAAKDQTNTVTVKLLKDVDSFGREGKSQSGQEKSQGQQLMCKTGAFVPISSGQMRNNWYPSGIATYVPHIKLRQLRQENASFERNHAYVTEHTRKLAERHRARAEMQELETEPETIMPGSTPIKVTQLTPQRATELLEIFVPPRIDFYRQAIEQEPTPQAQPQQAVSSAAAVMAAVAAKSRQETSTPTNIYGSVSISDVAGSITAALGENDEAARVVLSETDIQFVGLPEEDDKSRLKQIGDFAIEIQLKGASEPVKRVIRVLPLEAS